MHVKNTCIPEADMIDSLPRFSRVLRQLVVPQWAERKGAIIPMGEGTLDGVCCRMAPNGWGHPRGVAVYNWDSRCNHWLAERDPGDWSQASYREVHHLPTESRLQGIPYGLATLTGSGSPRRIVEDADDDSLCLSSEPQQRAVGVAPPPRESTLIFGHSIIPYIPSRAANRGVTLPYSCCLPHWRQAD
jgi:hypothetical protein